MAKQDSDIGSAVLALAFVFVVLCCIFVGSSLLLKLCWNVLVGEVFNGPRLGFGHSMAAVGLLMIIGSFFRGGSSGKSSS